ncbi:MAG: hypothetical protein HFE26_00010 [Clostridia bacterium]|nr:hypothetical protein [Clostridia bacterium]
MRARKIIFHVFSALVLAASVLAGSLCLTGIFWRTWEAVRDFGLSVAYYFTQLLQFNVITPTVTQLPRDFVEGIPEAWEQFVPWVKEFGRLFISRENVFTYLERVLAIVGRVALVLACCLPLFLVFAVLVWRFLRVKNKDHGKVSKPLAWYLTFRRKVLLKVKRFVCSYVSFCKRCKAYPIAFLCVWGYFFNVGTFVLEFFAFLFYFAASFDLAGIFVMLVKLVSDLVPVVRFLPWWVWLVIGAYALDRWRREHAYKKLKKFEEKNREFINERPIVTMLCGSMRKKKTTIITDMALSVQEMFREQALNDMRDINVKFKNFPWQNFELFIKRTIRKRKTPTLAKVELLVREIETFHELKDERVRRGYLRHLKRVYSYPYNDFCFGYDTNYGMTFNNGMKKEKLFDLLAEYGRLYYIYTNPTAIVSNYAVRSDASKEDKGNFPKWKGDFFKQKPVTEQNSVMSHIADQDMFRLGRVSDESNPLKDAFEYGVVCMTEIGKERGNQFDTKGQSKDDERVNQVNDLFNMELKMIGHSATVYHYPYVRFLCDDQRPESWGADARELCDIVDIIDGGKAKIMLPLFAFGEALFAISEKIFRKVYDMYTFNRGDLTLTKYFLMNMHALIYTHYKRIYNNYSVCTAKLTVQAGTMDEKRKGCKYYLCTRKIYADRFSSDCYHKFYTKKALRSKVGILDMPQYEELNPSFAELVKQKSHFIGTIEKAFDGDLRKAGQRSGSSRRTR